MSEPSPLSKPSGPTANFLSLLRQAPDAACLLSAAGQLIEASEFFFDLLNYPAKEPRPQQLSEWDYQSRPEELQRWLAQSVTFTSEREYRDRDGRRFKVEVRGRRVEWDGQQCLYIVARDLTAQLRREEELRLEVRTGEALRARLETETRVEHLNRRQRVVLDTIPLGIAHVVDRKVVWANPAHDTIFGYLPAASTGRETSTFYASLQDFSRVGEESAECLRQGRLYSTEVEMRRKDGTEVWCNLLGRAIDPGEPKLGAIWVVQDVTERKRSQRALEESEQRYRRLFEVESDAILVIDENTGHFVDANPAAQRLYGYSRAEFLDLTPADVSAEPAQTERVIAVQQKSIALRMHRKRDGSVFPIEASVNYFEAEGRRMHVVAIRDISERRKAEEALREGQSRFQALFSQSLVGAMQVHTDSGRFIAVNQRFCDMVGYSREELLQTNFQAITHPDDMTLSLETVQRCAANQGEEQSVEKRYIRKDGDILWVTMRILPLWQKPDSPDFHLTLVEDITRRKRIESALRESEHRFSTLFRASPVASAISRTQDGVLTDVNEAYLSLFGYQRGEMLGHSPLELGIWVQPHQRSSMFDRLERTGREDQFEVKLRRKSGEIGDFLVGARFVELNGEKCLFSTVLDITERKRLEDQLQQSQKMEGIGHLAGGVAHEFNNILGSMMMSLSLARATPATQENSEVLADLAASCRRAADLVRQLLAFSRQSVLERHPLDLAATVSRQLRMLKQFLGERLQIRLRSSADLPLVNADQSLIEQVVLNLCLNARDAMVEGGELEIDLAEEVISAAQPGSHPEARPGRYVRLSVTDTGCGMDEATLKRLFEPFFTTKEIGRGTGLGLATVRGIVQQHEGWVEVTSAVGQGSTFRVYLPVSDQTAPSKLYQADVTSASQAKATILIVEDDKKLQKLTSKLLSQGGYTVLEAGNGAEALQIWGAHRHEIDVLYTDMIMPGEFTGLQIAQQALQQKPELRVIITSGYNTDLVDLQKASEQSMVYLPKPCEPELLLETISKALAPRG